MVSNADDILLNRIGAIGRTQPVQVQGRVTNLAGLTVEVDDLCAPVGAQCSILTRGGTDIPAEVIGFDGSQAVLMPLDEMVGISAGDAVICRAVHPTMPIGDHLLGRVIDGHGRPIDGAGPLLCPHRTTTGGRRIQALQRTRIHQPIGTGIRAIDALMTCGQGQRMGIFSGPGVGKSVLLGMIAKYTSADVSVVALIGERGREVREFIEKELGPEGLQRSVVVVSTSDESAPLRVQAGFVAATVAEHFRDQGKNVLLMMDSVTRTAMAQRQIGLALGEPPATKGYTPSVFALLPRLVERCGKTEKGSITGFFTILVEGDDLTEPISDAMRGLLDGHLWLSRDLANRGHYPAIDVLESISRVMPDLVDEEHAQAARDITRLIAVYRDIEDLVNIGAYAPGANPEYDLAVAAHDAIDEFLCQGMADRIGYDDARAALAQLIVGLQQQPANPTATTATSTNNEEPKPAQSGPAPAMSRMMAGL